MTVELNKDTGQRKDATGLNALEQLRVRIWNAKTLTERLDLANGDPRSLAAHMAERPGPPKQPNQ